MTPDLNEWLKANVGQKAPSVPTPPADPDQLALNAEMLARGVRFLPAQVARRVLRARRHREPS